MHANPSSSQMHLNATTCNINDLHAPANAKVEYSLHGEPPRLGSHQIRSKGQPSRADSAFSFLGQLQPARNLLFCRFLVGLGVRLGFRRLCWRNGLGFFHWLENNWFNSWQLLYSSHECVRQSRSRWSIVEERQIDQGCRRQVILQEGCFAVFQNLVWGCDILTN